MAPRNRLAACILALFATAILLACGSNPATPQKVGDSTGAGTETPQKAKVFKVGDKVQLGDHVLTVKSVKISKGGQFDKPKAGKQFLVVTVQIENKGTSDIDYNPFDFKLRNSQGAQSDQSFTTINQDTALESGTLAPKGRIVGSIPFEAKIGEKGLVLIFTPSWLGDDRAEVKLR